MTPQENMARDDATTAIRFPIRLLTTALVLTTMAFAWFGWIIFDERRDAKMFQDESLRVEELRGVIVHLDEVLTMSARMAAATGDPKWEERYRRFEPQLDAAIKETTKLGTTLHDSKAAARTDEANIKLVEMEYRAFALVRGGRKEEAQAVVFSPEYEAQKKIYAEGITSFNSQIRREVDEHERQDKRTDFLSLIGALAVLAISFAAWLSVVRSLQCWRTDLEQAVSERKQTEQALRQAHDELEVRIEQRTAELGKTNETLWTENTERNRAERMLRESEEKFRQLAGNITDVFWMTTPDMQEILYVSPAYETLWGRSLKSLQENPHEWLDAIHPEDRDKVARTFGRQVSEEANVNVEYRVVRPDGIIRWVMDRGFAVRDEAGKIYRTVGIISDITERKRTETALRSSEERFRIAAETTNDVIYEWDLKQSVEWLGKIDEMLGYEPGEFPRTLNGWAASVHPEDSERTMAAIQAHLEGRVPFAIEYRVRRKDGVYRWWSARGAVARTPDGKPTRWIGSITDFTGRKQAEERLTQEHDLSEAILNNMPGLFYLITEKGRFLRWNRQLETVSGYSGEEIARMHPLDIFPAEHKGLVAEQILQVFKTGRSKVEANLLTKQGEQLPFYFTGGTVIVDGQPCLAGTGIDITERKRMETALRESDARYRALFNESVDGILIADIETKTFKYANQALCRMLGYTEDELRTMGVLDIHPKDAVQSVVAEFEAQACGDKTRATDIPCLRKDGSVVHADINAGKITIDGRPCNVGFFRDNTERKRLEAQVFQSQKLETVGKLAGGIAHEFNSILTAIIGQSELLLGDLPAGSPLAKNATEISKAASRAATLTQQLLAYGRKQFLQPENLDLNPVIASMEGMFHHLMGIDVDTQIVPAAGLKAVNADAGQIEQVIMNLVINARDAMPNGGKLTLETANVSFDRESVGRNPELKPGDYVMLAITDTGAGMSEEAKARVFEPFFTTKGVGQGTGLGLSTCYGIIKQSGGHISVYSEPGRGTTFKIYLPQVEPQTKIPMQRLDSPDLPRGTETILLVEDDPALREMAATLLRRLGYTVLAAANGIEALSLKQQRDNGHIDLLFTDVVMPHMNGQELSERVRALYPHTRILFTSAYTENAIVHQGVLDQGVALLQKPFTPSALAHKLREVLDQPNAPKPDPAQKTSGFAKISEEAKTPGN